MPIVYDKTKNGFTLQDPTQEELEALERIAVDYVTLSLGKMAALSFIKSIEQSNPEASEEREKEAEKKIIYN